MIRARTVCPRYRTRCLRCSRQPRHQEAGFVLLLGFFGGLVLLLSSLSIQTAALQARSSEFNLQRRRQQDDALASAAQVLVGRLAAVPCALGLPLASWTTVVEAPAAAPPPPPPCMVEEALKQLSSGTLPAPDAELGTFLLADYAPQRHGNGIDGAQLTVRWTPAKGQVSQRRFQVLLAATGSDGALQLKGVRP